MDDEEISSDFNSSDPSSSISSSSSLDYFLSSSIPTISSTSNSVVDIQTPNQNKLLNDKICSQELGMMKFLGTLNTKKLDQKHKPRLRRTAFLEWISQLEIAFSSNKYTRTILANYSVNNKIESTSDKRVDLLVYTVVYAFLEKTTRIRTSGCKSQGTKLLKVLHIKCASVDAQTK